MGKSSKFTCWQVDYAANRNLLEEARRAGVKKFIYTSVVRAPGLDKLALVRAKRAFEEELKRSGMPHTILYPNGFFSDMDEFLTMARKGRACGRPPGPRPARLRPLPGRCARPGPEAVARHVAASGSQHAGRPPAR